MKRSSVFIAIAVFFISTFLELLMISLVPGHFKAWYALPDRHFIFMARLAMNMIIGVSAGLLVNSAQRNAELMRMQEEQKEMQEAFLNHHVRNALCSLQYAAYLTRDQAVMQHCEAAISRIVWALSNAHQMEGKETPDWTGSRTISQSNEIQASSDEGKNKITELQ